MLQQPPLVPSDPSLTFRLRATLDRLERQVVVMYDTPGGTAEAIAQADELAALLAALAGQRVDLRAEESRVEALRQRLEREAVRIVRHVERNDQAARLAGSPTWERLRAQALATRRRRLRRALVTGAALAVVVAALAIILPRLPSGPPRANTSRIEERLLANDLPGALEVARQEQARAPNDPDIWLWTGALELKAGDRPAAERAWSQARGLYGGDERAFLIDRGAICTQLGLLDAAQADAEALLRLPDGAGFGNLLLAQVKEARGDRAGAIAALEEAARLADASGDAQLAVIAKARLAVMMQQISPFPTPTP
jgi:tetratricopeptide (TPR) repeat protein